MKKERREVRGLFLNQGQLLHCVDELKDAEFKPSSITVFSSEVSGNFKKNKVLEGSLIGAGIGISFGASLGYFSTWSRSTPLLGSFIGALIFGLLAALGGGLIGRQIPKGYLKGYEPNLGSDEILLSVEVEDEEEEQIAQDIILDAGSKKFTVEMNHH